MKHQYNQRVVDKNWCGLFASATAVSNLWDYHISDTELKDMYISTGRVGNGWKASDNTKQFLSRWNKKFPTMRTSFLKVKVLDKLDHIKNDWMIGVISIRRNTDWVIDWLDGDIDNMVKWRTMWRHAICLAYENNSYILVDSYLWVKPHNVLKIPKQIIIDSVNSWGLELMFPDMYYAIKGKVLNIPIK